MIYSDPRDNKFSDWNSTCGYYEKEPLLASGLLKTDSVRNLNDTSKYLRTSVEVSKKMYLSNKSAVLKSDAPPIKTTTSSSLFRTTSTKSFIDPKSWKAILESKYDEELWLQSFNRFVRLFSKNPTSRDSSLLEDAFIPQDDIAKVVIDCLGPEVPSFIVDKFVKLGREQSKERRISWSNFSALVPRVVEIYNAEISKKTEIPALVKLMSKPRLVDPKMGPLGDISTVYRDTIDSVAPSSAPNFAGTCRSPSTVPAKTFNPTAMALYAGTPKVTLNPPGFQGHIPLNVRNHKKNEHSYGSVPHPVKNDLLLTTKLSVLGYTGHFGATGELFSERITACDPRTSNGAAFGPQRRIL